MFGIVSSIKWILGYPEEETISLEEEKKREEKIAIKLKEYTITEIIHSETKSNTIICKGTDKNSNKLYFKIGIINNNPDNNTENNTDYELYVYEQLHKKKEEEPEISKYFMDYDKEISGIITYKNFIENIQMPGLIDPFLLRLRNIAYPDFFTEYTKIVLLVTYDFNTITLKQYLDKMTDTYILNTQINPFINFITVLILIINSIKILNKLGINHNNMHAGNILIKENENTKYKVDIYDKKSNILNSNIKIIIYDFDLSYVSNSTNKKNKKLNNRCNNGYGCNEFLSNRNYYFFIQLIYVLSVDYNKPAYSTLRGFLLGFLEEFIPEDIYTMYIYNMDKIIDKKAANTEGNRVTWNASCVRSYTNYDEEAIDIYNCKPNTNSSFNWVQDIPHHLNKFILTFSNPEAKFDQTLFIIETTPASKEGELDEIQFQKKYLKYKHKYLKLLKK
jgi:hypothetical protein